jgi:hypothetical protein
MQTTKWGPSGWCLLHAIANNYPEHPTLGSVTVPTPNDKKNYSDFFTHIGLILPCKYCRESYQDFIRIIPIDSWLVDRQSLSFWLYLIHNLVNDKLRKQGYLQTQNPPFAQVRSHHGLPLQTLDCGWDFIYAIVFNYPELTPTTDDMANYAIFFDLLTAVLPASLQHNFIEYMKTTPLSEHLGCRDNLTSWTWGLHEYMYDSKSVPEYSKICQKYEGFRAGCTLNQKANSCRTPATPNINKAKK